MSPEPSTRQAERQADRQAERQLARTILPSSGTMIGICTTLIGLVKLNEARLGPSRVDEYGGLVGLLFLASAALSYLAIRYDRRESLSRRCEQVADILFILGLFSLTLVAVLFAYEVI